ncbi:sensor histidine kinase [Streptomyces durbertensis]|nr:sensor histidine kinase [Streptomyces durbertensis]
MTLTTTRQQFVQRFVSALGYLCTAGATALAAFVGLYALLVVFALSIVGPGLCLLPSSLTLLRRGADFHRRFAGRWLGRAIPSSYRDAEGKVLVRAQVMLTDKATYTDLLWLLTHALLGTLGAAMALGLTVGAFNWLTTPIWWRLVPQPPELMAWPIDSWWAAVGVSFVGLAYGIAACFLLPWCAQLHALMTQALLRPRQRRTSLAKRVEELTITRAEALEAHAAELRRIERDLHDGAQAGLVSVSMRLAMMRKAHQDNPDQLPEMIDQARDLTDQALRSLRVAVRSIYPPVLMDHGLAEAARALVAASQIPTELDLQYETEGARAPAAVEAAAYFVISEALTNVAKHSGATNSQVRLRTTEDRIHISVWDNGKGGAAADSGSGIHGIKRRVAAFDGVTELHSPPGGPTALRVELPCGS